MQSLFSYELFMGAQCISYTKGELKFPAFSIFADTWVDDKFTAFILPSVSSIQL